MDKYFNYGLGAVIIAALILFIASLKEEQLGIENFVALMVVFLVLLIAPLFGLILAVPIVLLAWMRYHRHILEIFNRGLSPKEE